MGRLFIILALGVVLDGWSAVSKAGSPAAGRVRGYVADSLTGMPVEGARITISGPSAGRTSSSTFGFFTLDGLTNGVDRIVIEHPAYLPFGGAVSIPSGGVLRRKFLLEPSSTNRFDIYVQVADVTSGLQLAGVPVAAQLFTNVADAMPAETTIAPTDGRGYLVLRGMRPGFYRFEANRAGGAALSKGFYDPYTTLGTPDDKRLLQQDHLANVLLKPIPQSLTAQVIGFDPVAQAVLPLKNYGVDLTGVDPADPARTLVPTRSGVTDTNGLITFTGLPAIAWRFQGKRLSYAQAEQLVYPDVEGRLPSETIVLQPVFEPAELRLTLVSAYQAQKAHLFSGLPVWLRGLRDSGTEGIERRLTNGTPANIRLFTNLVAGRYQVTVDGPGASNAQTGFQPAFSGSDYFEILPGRTTEAELALDPGTARVRGRLWAAEELGAFALPVGQGNRNERKPIYRPREQAGIEFIEYGPDGLLALDANILTAEADEAGQFAIDLVPARYGVRVPGLSNYWGNHVQVLDLTGKSGRSQGWPFAFAWPYGGVPPANGTTNGGVPLVMLPRREYQLDLFVHRQQAYLRQFLYSELSMPTRYLVLSVLSLDQRNPQIVPFQFYDEIVLGGASATLLAGDGTVLTQPLRAFGLDQPFNPALIEFAGLKPGTNTLTVSVPRRTFSFWDVETQSYSRHSLVRVLPEWQPPGVLPSSNPSQLDFVAPLGIAEDPSGGTGTFDTSGRSLRLEVHALSIFTQEYVEPPEIITEPDRLAFVSPAYAGTKLFAYPAILPLRGFHPPLPPGEFDYWIQFDDKWYRGQAGASGDVQAVIWVGGPNDNANAPPPAPAYNLTLVSINADDPLMNVSGTFVELGNGAGTVPMAGQTLNGITNQLGSRPPFNAHWQTVSYATELIDPLSPTLRFTAQMRRGLGLRGSVTNTAAPAGPLRGALVRIFDRFGSLVGQLTNQVDGTFASPSALPNTQTLYLEVTAPGFIPSFKRVTPGDAIPSEGDPDALELVIDARLDPLPPPQIRQVKFDRFGLFLPGVKKAGFFDERAPLTLTWSAEIELQTYDYSPPRFDTAEGAALPSPPLQYTDALSEIWLVVPRSFASSSYNDPGLPLTVPPADQPAALHAWLEAIRSRSLSNVFHRVVSTFRPTPDPTVVRATHQLPLWQLPAGFIDPVFVAVTQGGAVSVLTNYTYPSAKHQLEGVRLPPWMAGASDLLGVAAGTQATANALKSIVPAGRFLPLPNPTARISTNADGFLAYDYTMKVEWKEGMDAPVAGLLQLGPNFLGMDFAADLQFGLDGSQGRAYLALGAELAKDEIDFAGLLPLAFRESIQPEAGVFIRGASSSIRNFDLARPFEFEVTHGVTGRVDVAASLNLRPITSRLPYVGPIFATLDEIRAAQFFADLKAGVGLESSLSWQTTFPPVRDFTSPHPDPQVLRRHFIGGKEGLTQRASQFDLCFNFGAGLRAVLLGGKAGASGSLSMEGNDCAGEPSVRVTPNTLGDWPPLQRIQGAFNAHLDAYLDLWITRLGASWDWRFLEFDFQFGTEPVFQLIPIQVARQILRPGQGPLVQFNPTQSNLVDHLPPTSSFASGAGSRCGLLFVSPDPATGQMRLLSSFQSGSGWREPVTVAVAPGVVASSLLPLATGWLAVWSELAAADLDNPFPATTLRFSLSDPTGSTWSTPSVLASLEDVASQLLLIPLGSNAGLALRRSADGPVSASQSISLTVWNGASWSPLSTPVLDRPLAALTAAGTAGPALGRGVVAYTEESGEIRALDWDGTAVSPAQVIATNAAPGLSLAPDGAGGFVLACAFASDEIGLLRSTVSGAWKELSRPVVGVTPGEVSLAALSNQGNALFLLCWTEGANANGIWSAFTSATGSLVTEPRKVSASRTGYYSQLQLCPEAGLRASLLARYEDSSVQIVVFPISYSELGLAEPRLLSTGEFEFRVSANPPGPYRIQTSFDLRTWADFTNIVVTAGPTVVRDPAAGAQPRRYYRAIGP